MLQDIVNKTNIAEAKAGVNLVDVDMEQAAKDGEALGSIKQEDDDGEDGGMSQLAALVTAENQAAESKKKQAPKTDAIQAILTSVGVEYTHDNSEVIGSSKVEEQLSRQAEMTLYSEGDLAGQNALFADSDEEDGDGLHGTFNPPEEVRLRQFCEMARTFGFVNATEFALVVENWTQEARRNCLDTFYKRRETKLISEGLVKMEVDEKVGIKTKEEDVKREASFEEEIKGENKVKGEEMDVEVKVQRFKTKPLKAEGVEVEEKKLIKSEDKIKVEGSNGHFLSGDKDLIKNEDKFKLEGSSKRHSIFLSDDDDDDEL